jgi:hypothetical protein
MIFQTKGVNKVKKNTQEQLTVIGIHKDQQKQ